MTEIRFTIPGKPKPKGRPRFRVIAPKGLGKNGKAKKPFVHTYTPAETETEEGTLRHLASIAMAGRAPLTGPLILQMAIYLPVPISWSKVKREAALSGHLYPTSKPDWDNYAKIQDGLNMICWDDDAQIVDAHVYKRYSDTPRRVIAIKIKE